MIVPGWRLLDAFDGLEFSTLTKQQRRPIPLQVTTETDMVSIHSGKSASVRGPHHLPSASLNPLGRFGYSTGGAPSANNAGFPRLETVEEASDPALTMLEGEIMDIQQRRAEVVA